jgi:hypothetical protein
MQRMTAILTVCLCVVGGCRGSAAQEPDEGRVAPGQRGARAPISARAPEAEPIASEVDVPWAIALLSNAKTRTAKKTVKVMVVHDKPNVDEMSRRDVHFEVAIEPGAPENGAVTPTATRTPAPKTCSGVVNRRS